VNKNALGLRTNKSCATAAFIATMGGLSQYISIPRESHSLDFPLLLNQHVVEAWHQQSLLIASLAALSSTPTSTGNNSS
jgi:hypothetical protein